MMIHFILRLVAIIVVAVSFAHSPLPTFAEASPQELLSNPLFTSGAANWYLRDASVSALEGSQGLSQAVLNGVKPGKDSWSHVGTQIKPVPIDRQLKFSCSLRGTSPGQKLMVNAFAYDSSHRLLKSWSTEFSLKEGDWTPVATEYVAPSNAASLALWIVNRAKYQAFASKPSLLLGEFQKSDTVVAKETSKSASLRDKKESDDYHYDEHIQGWIDYTAHKSYEVGVDKNVYHSGSRSAYIKSTGPQPADEFGNLMQAIVPNNYLDQRVKLTAWVKTQLKSGTAQLWMRVDGDWKDHDSRPGTFDNMDDRPISGNTEWTPYSIVVDVPATANHVTFGLMHIGTGTIWLDDVELARVGKDVPLTGKYTTLTGCGKKEPINMNFEDEVK